MLTKKLLRFPELLLLLSMAIAPFFCTVSAMDVHLDDTYYVVGEGAMAWALIFLPFFVVLFVSWVFHVLLRLYHSPAGRPRTVQAMVSVVCFWVVVLINAHPTLIYETPGRFLDIGTWSTYTSYRPMFWIWVIAMAVLVLLQFSFWIVASVMLVKNWMRTSDQALAE